ncbi:hypothetical protein B1R32_101259 [Abditibacterium utsteinense]|uniref:Uncharacterized protein n=1 Tax=Abditibacterium utsteinense TaxID=1960156 RepID=A0A2S8SXJ3_9BACT|nr:hypothetical protein B1R32_101259 [Abditibacterium utsteinense]
MIPQKMKELDSWESSSFIFCGMDEISTLI